MDKETYRIVEDNITVRYDPKIYAFSSNTIPNYLKVGDTSRGVEQRVSEWESILSNRLKPQKVHITIEYEHSAKIRDMYFRDYSVHNYLRSIGKCSLADIDDDLLKIYSEEFFKDTKVEDIEAAIVDICVDAESDNPVKNYKFYKTIDRSNADFHYNNDKKWKLRPNQEEVVENYKQKEDQKELLMFAVMRFGKSFTAMQCALQTNCQKVLIVSAKADVKIEWKKTIEMPECFKDYSFVCDDDLKVGRSIDSFLPDENGKTKVAVFLTLQNLTGKASDGTSIKKRLSQIFDTVFDLIIVDETHFGAWSIAYGSPLNGDEDKDYLDEEKSTLKSFTEKTSKLKFKKKLHLSGTPYNLLYDNKFNDENIVATCQFKDILRSKREWEQTHKEDIEYGIINPETGYAYQEYDNPYYGFPQMLRFAFNIPQTTRELLTKSKKDGEKWSLNDLLETKHNKKDSKVSFLHENEVLQLLKMIDGSETDKEVLGFLNVPKIKDNAVCKHMVMVLPYKYSCDAMEQLLNRESDSFINLGEYEVLNITGHTLKAELNDVAKVKSTIERFEREGKKTITLTVQKMLTGVTVKEWDTMIMLKNTKSAQEYDQAIFRIQNQYVIEKEVEGSCGLDKEPKTLLIDMKPQTILVDFDPIRMFEIQGLSSRVVNEVKHRNTSLEDEIREELDFFPIITYNADKLIKVDPENLVEVITKYSSEKSIMDETSKVMLDPALLDDDEIKNFINSQSKADLSNKLTVDAHTGPESSFSAAGIGSTTPGEQGRSSSNSTIGDVRDNNNNQDKELIQKYRMCIANLSFYAFLSNSNIESLRDVLRSVDEDSSERIRNNRLFINLHLSKSFIQKHIDISSRITSLNINDVLRKANMLSKDTRLSQKARALNALNRFSRISDSEVVTPTSICNEMLNTISVDKLVEIINNGGKILNIAGKTGEFEFAIYQVLYDRVSNEKLRNAIYTIPTSSVTYEFTRLIYEILGLNITNLADKFTSYDLLNVKLLNTAGKSKEKSTKDVDYKKIGFLLTQKKPFNSISLDDTITEGVKHVKFDVVIGNPPYQEIVSKAEGNKSLGKQLFPSFIILSTKLAEKYVSLITPSKWFTSEGQDGSFVPLREYAKENNHFKYIKNYSENTPVFSGVSVGAVNYFLYDKSHIGNVTFLTDQNCVRPLFEDGMDIILPINQMVSIVKKVTSHKDFQTLMQCTYGRDAFGISGKQAFLNENTSEESFDGCVDVRCAHEDFRYIARDRIRKNTELVDKWKVYISKGNGAAGILDTNKANSIIGISYIGTPNTACSDSLIPIGPFDTEEEAINLSKYMATKFLRFMVGIMKASRNITQIVYKYVPLQDFSNNSDIDWSKDIKKIDEELYRKYDLTLEEEAFIESTIKAMNWHN